MQEQNSSSARYYNSDLSIWISVDPLSDKYPNLSPYTYCADNPVRLVDEDGREIFPHQNFRGTAYAAVHDDLLKNNSSYKKICSRFASTKKFNLYLNCNEGVIPDGKEGYTKYSYKYEKKGAPNIYPGITVVITEATSTETFDPQKAQEEVSLWHFYIVIHEMIHSYESLDYSIAQNNMNHNGFMDLIGCQKDIWNNLNSDLELGLTSSQIEELCMYGAEESSYFKKYITNTAFVNGTSKEQEIDNYHQRVKDLLSKHGYIAIPNNDK